MRSLVDISTLPKLTLIFTIMLVNTTLQQQVLLPNVTIANTVVLSDPSTQISIIQNGSLSRLYNDTVFKQALTCKNGDLNIIINDFNKTNATSLILEYSGISMTDLLNIGIEVSPNLEPKPQITLLDTNTISIDFMCPVNATNSDYYNKVDVQLTPDYRFSFLLNCDPEHRHKSFQIGYLIIAALDAAILISVAMHSRVWSLKWKGRKLRFDLRWFHALIICFVGVVLIAALYLFAFKDFDSAFITVRYVGIGISAPFLFICFNEPLFLMRALRTNIYKKMRYCDAISICLSIIVVVISVFVQNWILYNFIAVCLCVAFIKLLHFRSLKEAYLFMGIITITISLVAIISHYVLERSYNDYATQLSSPLFLMVPDFVNNLYKQCSWLPVIDVIVPGSMLSYLRVFDQNRSSRFGGVYTVWGNLTFVISTILWIGIQAIYPFSVPFCLVTYSCLMLVIFLFAWKRNQLGTLFSGNFEQDTSIVQDSRMDERSESFSNLVDQNLIKALKKSRQSQGSERQSLEEKEK